MILVWSNAVLSLDWRRPFIHTYVHSCHNMKTQLYTLCKYRGLVTKTALPSVAMWLWIFLCNPILFAIWKLWEWKLMNGIVAPGPYKQCSTPPRSKCQVSWATPWQETYLAQTHFRKTETTRNHPHQNVLATRMQVRTLYKQQTSHM
jgi:hypothetical protein